MYLCMNSATIIKVCNSMLYQQLPSKFDEMLHKHTTHGFTQPGGILALSVLWLSGYGPISSYRNQDKYLPQTIGNGHNSPMLCLMRAVITSPDSIILPFIDTRCHFCRLYNVSFKIGVL